MSASLVGSEMCIRDSKRIPAAANRLQQFATAFSDLPRGLPRGLPPVSYTHLTLPDDMQCVDLG
eukprot:3588377-Alexandrium_andersonii.AAC.1